jgi:hypothetical protein
MNPILEPRFSHKETGAPILVIFTVFLKLDPTLDEVEPFPLQG